MWSDNFFFSSGAKQSVEATPRKEIGCFFTFLQGGIKKFGNLFVSLKLPTSLLLINVVTFI